RQGCGNVHATPPTLSYCQGLCCGYIANSPLDTRNQVSQRMGRRRDMSEKGKVVTPAAPGLINKEDIPAVLPILPLRNSVFFPGGVLPLAVGRQKTIALIKDAVRDDQVIGVVTQRKDEVEIEALGTNLQKLAREVIEIMPELPAAATELVESITQPGHLADLIAANVDVPIEEKQQVLETVDLKERMKLVLELLNRKRE